MKRVTAFWNSSVSASVKICALMNVFSLVFILTIAMKPMVSTGVARNRSHF